ncbi:hypothetical protein N7539_002146 [Penicillium diatomitis]|uniref:Uncharacterized protein n=1 Tax=Penicillium diatomitis TaxID=2819901 RepID=A0A9W9XIY9_9EURO|nr:uncharacterized protein N7539_002146 [Penicillium diatomitis]KAJ5493400.1 hypothetical protein N7539_002146 [Penicillium diatomitis]
MDNASTYSGHSNQTSSAKSCQGDPRLRRATQRPSMNAFHSPFASQVATPAETPNTSLASDCAGQNTDQAQSLGRMKNSEWTSAPGALRDCTLQPNSLASIFLELSGLAATKALHEREKEALLEENVSIKRRLEKAQSRDAFPIIIENAQAEEANSKFKLRKVQSKIDEAETARRTVAVSLNESLRELSSNKPGSDSSLALVSHVAPDEENRVAMLEAENRRIKAELQEIKDQMLQQRLKTDAASPASISKLEKSVENQVVSNQMINKKLRRLEEWRENMEGGNERHGMTLSGHSMNLDSLQHDVKAADGKAVEAHRRAEALGDRLTVIQREITSLRTSIDLYSPSRQDFEKTMKAAESILQQVPDITAKIQALDSRFMAFKQSHDGKIHQLASDIRTEEVAARNSQSNAASKGRLPDDVKNAVENLETSHKSLRNTVNKLLLDMPQVHKCLAMQESIVAAVRSLENRYSNINSENLVKNMASAMTEMYPCMPQALEQLHQLKSYCTQEISALRANEKRLHASVDSRFEQAQTGLDAKLLHLQKSVNQLSDSLKEQLEDTWEFKNKFQTHADAFSELAELIPEAQGQAEKMNEALTNFGKISQQVLKFEEYVANEEAKNETLDQLSEKLQALSQSVNSSMSNHMNDSARLSDQIDHLTANYENLEASLKAQHEIISVEQGKRMAESSRIDHIWKQIKLEIENRKEPDQVSELSMKLESLVSNVRSLQTRLDNEMKVIIERLEHSASAGELGAFKNDALARFEKLAAILSATCSDPSSPGEQQTTSPPSGRLLISNGDGIDYRILGSAARNSEREQWSGSPVPPPPRAEVGDYESVSSDDVMEQEEVCPSSPSASGNNASVRKAAVDMPIAMRISEEGRAWFRKDPHSPTSNGSPSPKTFKSEPKSSALAGENAVWRAESGPSRKRPRRNTLSDDGHRSGTSSTFRPWKGVGASNESEAARLKKQRKKEKRERKEQRRRQKALTK